MLQEQMIIGSPVTTASAQGDGAFTSPVVGTPSRVRVECSYATAEQTACHQNHLDRRWILVSLFRACSGRAGITSPATRRNDRAFSDPAGAITDSTEAATLARMTFGLQFTSYALRMACADCCDLSVLD